MVSSTSRWLHQYIRNKDIILQTLCNMGNRQDIMDKLRPLIMHNNLIRINPNIRLHHRKALLMSEQLPNNTVALFHGR